MPRIVDAPQFPDAFRWPVTLHYGRLWLTPFRPRDVDEVWQVRARNAAWLKPWDATSPTPAPPVDPVRRARQLWRAARQGLTLPWLVRWAGGGRRPYPVIGQCTVSGILYGSALTGSIGYWLDRNYAGRSIMPAAVALATDYAMRTVGLHRIEICIRPENAPSLKVVQKLGFREEGLRPGFIHIAGDWRDHQVFALTAEEVPAGLLARVPRSVVFPDDPA